MPLSPALTAGTDYQLFTTWHQLWAMARDVNSAAGAFETLSRSWPQGTYVYAQGRIRSASVVSGDTADLVCEDYAAALFAWNTVGTTGYDDWAGYGGPLVWRPSSYDVTIETCSPQESFRVQITAQPGVSTIRAAITAHLLTEYAITLSDLVGRRFKIVRRGGTGYFERWPDFPNAAVRATGTIDSGTTTTIVDIRKNFPAGTFSTGREVMFFDTGDVLRRKVISGATGQTITFASTPDAPMPNSPYYVIQTDGLWRWSGPDDDYPRGGYLMQWYTGVRDGILTHKPDDTRSLTGVTPTSSVSVSRGVDAGLCAGSSLPMADADPWIPPEESVCAGADADKRFNLNVTKSYRWLQKFVEAMCGTFFNPLITWDGSPALYSFRRATLFEAANIGLPQRATVSSIDGAGLGGNIHVTLSTPYLPIEVYFCAEDSDGNPVPLTDIPEDDLTGVYDGTKINGFYRPDLAGLTLVASFGWKRRHPWMVERLYDVTIWVPADNGMGGIVNPPTSADPGTYITYPASTRYLEPLDNGIIAESSDSNYDFVDDRLARLVGDNFHTPIPGAATETADAAFRERWFTGTRGRVAQKKMNASLSGRATAIADNRHFSDSTKNWFDVDWWAGGVLVTHTGTSNDGSTTTLIDTTKAADGFWTQAGRFVDMVVQISDGAGNWYKRVVTAHSGTLQRLTLNYALPFSASGKDYILPEPNSVRGRFKGLPVYLTGKDAGGNIVRETATVEGHDDIGLFVTPPTAIVADLGYRIAPPAYGGVHRYSGGTGKHTAVTGGVDARGGGGVPFHRNSRENLPEFATRYGLARHGDYFFDTNAAELVAAMSLLRITEIPLSPTNPDNDDFFRQEGRLGSTPSPDTWQDVYDDLEARWNTDVGTSATGLPFAWGEGHFNFGTPTIISMTIERQMTRFLAQPIPQGDCTISRTVKVYVYAQVDASGVDNAGVDHPKGHADGESFCWAAGGSSVQNWEQYAFDDNGDDVLYRAWSEVVTLAPADAAESATMATPIGATLVAPNVPAVPSPGGCFTGVIDANKGSEKSYRGYVVTAARGLAYWSYGWL